MTYGFETYVDILVGGTDIRAVGGAFWMDWVHWGWITVMENLTL